MAKNNGFDAIREGLGDGDNQFNVHAFDKISDFFSGLGIDADSATIGTEDGSALENGLDYKELAGKVDPETYNYLHTAYWHGDWDASKRKK